MTMTSSLVTSSSTCDVIGRVTSSTCDVIERLYFRSTLGHVAVARLYSRRPVTSSLVTSSSVRDVVGRVTRQRRFKGQQYGRESANKPKILLLRVW